MTCHDCAGARTVPDDVTGGYAPCPCFVIDAGMTFIVWEAQEDSEVES